MRKIIPPRIEHIERIEPRPDGVPDWSPFGNPEDDHSVDGFSDKDAESVQEGVPDGSPFGNLKDDNSVD